MNEQLKTRQGSDRRAKKKERRTVGSRKREKQIAGRPLSLTKPISEDISGRKEVIYSEELWCFLCRSHMKVSRGEKKLVSELVIAGKNGGKLSPFIFLEEVQDIFKFSLQCNFNVSIYFKAGCFLVFPCKINRMNVCRRCSVEPGVVCGSK